MPYSRYFDEAISKLKGERRYRVFADLERDAKAFPHALWHGPDRIDEVVIWCSDRQRLRAPQIRALPYPHKIILVGQRIR